MRQILLDSTGLYNAELAMRKIAKKHEDTSGLHKFEYDALFNIVSAIVLWDEVVIFDEEFCSRSLKSLAFFNEYENLFKKADTHFFCIECLLFLAYIFFCSVLISLYLYLSYEI